LYALPLLAVALERFSCSRWLLICGMPETCGLPVASASRLTWNPAATLCLSVATVGFRNISKGLMSIPFVRRVSRSVFSDWVKALFVMFLLPLL